MNVQGSLCIKTAREETGNIAPSNGRVIYVKNMLVSFLKRGLHRNTAVRASTTNVSNASTLTSPVAAANPVSATLTVLEIEGDGEVSPPVRGMGPKELAKRFDEMYALANEINKQQHYEYPTFEQECGSTYAQAFCMGFALTILFSQMMG